jgi:tripartite-type tricarboxylate transporter receptor subunit TctC
MMNLILVLLLALGWISTSLAQTPFYQGKTIRLVAGTPAGSVYDLYARMVAQFLPKHIPGAPNILETLGKEIVAQPLDVIERMKKLLGT